MIYKPYRVPVTVLLVVDESHIICQKWQWLKESLGKKKRLLFAALHSNTKSEQQGYNTDQSIWEKRSSGNEN